MEVGIRIPFVSRLGGKEKQARDATDAARKNLAEEQRAELLL